MKFGARKQRSEKIHQLTLKQSDRRIESTIALSKIFAPLSAERGVRAPYFAAAASRAAEASSG
ncbi:hypothetical protein NIES2104_52100 [Leptolyngbya sp. NIES-2104]|nr:hypothetical protein NIES2104_52100 [Leptolyngbya sp. NIES-2104]